MSRRTAGRLQIFWYSLSPVGFLVMKVFGLPLGSYRYFLTDTRHSANLILKPGGVYYVTSQTRK